MSLLLALQPSSGSSLTVQLSGNKITSALGSLDVAPSVGLTGNAVTSAVGTLTPVVSVPTALRCDTTQFGTDYVTLGSAPDATVGILVSGWVKSIHTPGVYPLNIVNQDALNIRGTNWDIQCVPAATTTSSSVAGYTDNCMIFGSVNALVDIYAGDYLLNSDYTINEATALGWVFCSFFCKVNGTNDLVITQKYRYLASSTFFTTTATVTVASLRTLFNTSSPDAGWATWVPGAATGFSFGNGLSVPFDLCRVRVDQVAAIPSDATLLTISNNSAADTAAWADYEFDWLVSPVLSDRSGHGRTLTNNGTLYSGQTLPATSSPDVTVGATGNTLTSAVGSLAVTLNPSLTGNAITAVAGSLKPTIAVTLTGNAIAAAAGVLLTGDSDTLTGNALTAVVGSLAPSTLVAATGNGGTFVAGLPTAQIVATGNAGTFAIGVMAVTINTALTGYAGTFVAGAPTGLTSLAPTATGNGAVFAIGAMAVTTNKALTGNAAVFAIGAPVVGSSIALTGNAAVFAAGTPAVGLSIALTGNSAIFAIGSLTATSGGNITVTATGSAGTFAIGAMSPAIAKALTGYAGTFAAGSPVAGISEAITGNAITSAYGSLGVSLAKGLTGDAAAFAIGAMTVGTSKALTGYAITANAGTPVTGFGLPLIGNAGSFAAGTLAVINTIVVVALTGYQAGFDIGILRVSIIIPKAKMKIGDSAQARAIASNYAPATLISGEAK